jgi:Zn-dependent protease with chaperone function
MRKLLSAFSALFLIGNVSAQSIAPLEPHGKLPGTFYYPSHDVVDDEIARRKATGDAIDIQEQNFMREMGYFSQQRMLTGLVLFNDSLSNYISKVAAVLLKDDTATLKQLHFYAYKSPDPNAFTSATGTILVTVGLLGQLDNEAQLAYILSHEITHYRQHHMLKGYLNREELKANSNGTPSFLLMSSYYSYNQEQELEADRLGFELYKKSPYSIKEALRSFDVLEYSDLPFDDVPFDTLFFNKDYMTIPVGYYLTKVDPIYSDDNYEDRNSTHPNVRKRRMALMTEIENQADSVKDITRHSFLVSKDEFLRVREMSRYEICRLYLIDRAYPEAIYCSYMMLKRHPNDLYLQKIIGRSLYELAAYNQEAGGQDYYDPYSFSDYNSNGSGGGRFSILNRDGYYRIPDYKEYPGQQQQLFHLFHELEPDELTVLALSYNWGIHRTDPSDLFQTSLCDSLFAMLVNNQNLHYSYFSTISPDSAKSELRKDSIQRALELGESGDSKYSRMDKFRLNDDKERFTKFAFVKMMNDSEFVNKFKYYTDHRSSLVHTDDGSDWYHNARTHAERKQDDADEATYGMGIGKVIVVNPDYEKYAQKDRRDDPDQDYTLSEEGQANLGAVINTQAKNAGVECVMLNPFMMDSLDGDTFADLAILNEWFYERLQHGSKDYVTTMNDQAQIDSVIRKYGTRYVMFTMVESDTYKKIQRPFWFAVSCIAVIPAVRAFIPRQTVSYDNVVLDLKTGKVVSIDHQRKKKGKENENTNAFYKKLFEKMHRPKKPNTDGKPVTDEERGM